MSNGVDSPFRGQCTSLLQWLRSPNSSGIVPTGSWSECPYKPTGHAGRRGLARCVVTFLPAINHTAVRVRVPSTACFPLRATVDSSLLQGVIIPGARELPKRNDLSTTGERPRSRSALANNPIGDGIADARTTSPPDRASPPLGKTAPPKMQRNCAKQTWGGPGPHRSLTASPCTHAHPILMRRFAPLCHLTGYFCGFRLRGGEPADTLGVLRPASAVLPPVVRVQAPRVLCPTNCRPVTAWVRLPFSVPSPAILLPGKQSPCRSVDSALVS